jgi:hypothetical protein
MHPGKATATARSAAIFRRRVDGGRGASGAGTVRAAVGSLREISPASTRRDSTRTAVRGPQVGGAARRGSRCDGGPMASAPSGPAPGGPHCADSPEGRGMPRGFRRAGRRLAHPTQQDFLGRQGGSWRVAGRGDGSLIQRSRHLRAGRPDAPWDCTTAGLAARRAPSRAVLAALLGGSTDPPAVQACAPDGNPRTGSAHASHEAVSSRPVGWTAECARAKSAILPINNQAIRHLLLPAPWFLRIFFRYGESNPPRIPWPTHLPHRFRALRRSGLHRPPTVPALSLAPLPPIRPPPPPCCPGA